MPDIDATILSNFGTPPTYTPPSITNAADGSMGNDTDMDVSEMSTAAWTALDYDFDDQNIDFLKWFQVAGDFIQNEEDTELAQAQLGKISTYIQAYTGAMQNQLNIFNDANTEYQAKVQEGIQQAQINSQKAMKQAEIDASKVTTQAQLDSTDAQQEANLLLQKETQEYANKLQKYSADLVAYQAEVGEEAQKLNSIISNAAFYSGEAKKYYDWAQKEVASYMSNNSKMIGMAMASQASAKQGT